MLSNIPAPRETEKVVQRAFGGLDRRPGSRSSIGSKGNLLLVPQNMRNMCADKYPLMTTRRPRKPVVTLTKPNGMTVYDGKYVFADGTDLKIETTVIGAVTDTSKVFATLGNRLLVWPDKKMWDGTTFSSLEATFSATGLSFHDGTYAGEDAKANCITTSGADPFPFNVGDAVTITGCAVEPANNKTPIIREISNSGKTLHFYENTFTIPEGQTSVTETGSVSLARNVPDIDFLCVNENRVWGCKGDTICCSKLGDPTNWNVFDGISTDAWSVESGTQGEFTACISFMGYPIFFKEDRVFKVYGNRPTNYEVMGAATLGVLPGCSKSLAVAGETLYYLSRAGVCAYTGGFPSLVGQELENGAFRWDYAAAGSDGKRYYISLGYNNVTHNYVYDTTLGTWHLEDVGNRQTDHVWVPGYAALFSLGTDGKINCRTNPKTFKTSWGAEDPVESNVTFAPIDMGVFGGKYPVRAWIRYETVRTATIKVYISYDDGTYELTGTLPAKAKCGTCDTPLPIRRCDHFSIRLVCEPVDYDHTNRVEGFTLYDIELDVAPGVGSRK